jgi:hypothetical protein
LNQARRYSGKGGITREFILLDPSFELQT